jgi:hypothetical protein
VLDAQSIVSTLYGLGGTASDLAGYHVLSNGFGSAARYVAITNAAATNGQYVARFAETLSRFNVFQGGHDVVASVYAAKGTSGAASLAMEVYFMTTNGVTLAEYSSPAVALSTSASPPFILRTPIPTNLVFSVPIRRAIKFKLSGVGTPAPTVYVYSEDGRPLTIEFPVLSGEFATTEELSAVDSRVVTLEARPLIPTNAVSGWLMYDGGSNRWVSVSVSNMVFYGDYIDE